MATKRIGIPTGGGNVRGLNSVIKAAACRGNKIDWEVDRSGSGVARRSS